MNNRVVYGHYIKSPQRGDLEGWHSIVDDQLADQLNSAAGTPTRYYYHSDHLGSTSSITNSGGTVIQHIQYMPYGEVFIDKKTTGFDTPYKFSGKEIDSETGYSNFHARIYGGPNGDIITFISVDPLADKYPGISPYAYCANNPLKYVDPTGMIIEPTGEAEGKAYQEYRAKVFSNNKKYGHIQKELTRLEGAEEIFKIRMGENVTSNAGGGNFAYNKETGEFDVNIGNGGDFSTMGKLAHELKHADQYMDGKLGFDLKGNGKLGKAIAYDKHDELEAFSRQGMFGKTLTSDEVHNSSKYKNLPFFKSNETVRNIRTNNYNFGGIKNENKSFYENTGKPRIMYHGWKKDTGR